MKAAPVIRALALYEGIRQTLVHTGQHYDANMSEIFFRQLDIPEPDFNLGVGSGSHSVQTAEIMVRLEQLLVQQRPNLVLVYGDVNSTVAAALVCSKLLIPVAHVEAGLRSFDRTMPEEINRILTDQIAEFLFTPSYDANENLMREGVSREKIHLVGNVMIDTLVHLLPRAMHRWETECSKWKFDHFGIVTLHRPSNVDHLDKISFIVKTLIDISRHLPLIFPVHPRTRKKLDNTNCITKNSPLHLTDPLGYLDFLALLSHATLVITDSGGIQEETSYLGIPCLTIRENTERPVTVEMGTNVLIGQNMGRLQAAVDQILSGNWKRGQQIPFWDGKAAQRIADIIVKQTF